MDISFEQQQLSHIAAELAVLAVRETKDLAGDPGFAALDALTGGRLASLAKDEGFSGKAGTQLRVPVQGLAAPWVCLVGLGEQKSSAASNPEPRSLDSLAKVVAGLAKQRPRIAVGISLDAAVATDAEAVAHVVESLALGLQLAAYKYERFRKPSDEETLDAQVILAWADGGATPAEGFQADEALKRARILAESTNLARDLVNEPPNSLSTVALAERCESLAKRFGVSCDIWGPDVLERERMALFLAVARGSASPAQLVRLHYAPPTASGKQTPRRKVTFVGKGLTFDSGGLSLKPAKSMETMKLDMGGAATTLGIMLAAARLGVDVELTAYIGIAENMPGPDAYRPGDVYQARNGKFVEVINTDAEGRLVLADVLAYAAEEKPDLIVDHATLTGACMVALGPYVAGLFTPDDALATDYAAAATRAGEGMWRLPLQDALAEGLKSDIADMKHTGEALGGAISAAHFLHAFVGEVPWVHIDLAGPSFLERPHGLFAKGATGFGIRAAIAYLEALKAA